jgi:MFS family permease
MTVVAVIYQVWEATRSPVWVGAIGLAQAIPVGSFGLFAGALVDRSDRRKLCLAGTAGLTTCSVLLALQAFLGHWPITGVLMVVAAQSCCSAVGGPAARTFIPRLLPRAQQAAGLALNRIANQGAMLVGPAAGGLIVAGLGIGGCYLVDAVTFGPALVATLALPPMPPDGQPSRPGLHGVLEGLRFLAGNPTVRGALLTDLAATVLSMPLSVFPLINAERFGGNPRTLGFFLSAIAVGGVVASVFSGTFSRFARPGMAMLAGSTGWGASLVLFGLATSLWLALTFLALAGAADTVAVVSRGTVVQLFTPDPLLGRVAAAEQIVGSAGPDIGNVRGGLIAGITSGTAALISGGLLCVVAVALVDRSTPQLRGCTTTAIA